MQKAIGVPKDSKKCKTKRQIKKWLSQVKLGVFSRSTFVDFTDKKQPLKKSNLQELLWKIGMKESDRISKKLFLTKSTAQFEDS